MYKCDARHEIYIRFFLMRYTSHCTICNLYCIEYLSHVHTMKHKIYISEQFLNAIYVALSICIIYAIKKIMHIRRVAKTDIRLIKHVMRSKCEGHICIYMQNRNTCIIRLIFTMRCICNCNNFAFIYDLPLLHIHRVHLECDVYAS